MKPPTPLNLATPQADPPISPYLRTRILTAPPEELRLLLLEGALKFTAQARDALAARNFEGVYLGVTKARDIILELMLSIRPEHNPALADRVRALYSFLYTHLTEASFEKDDAKFAKVLELLEFERETWALALARLAQDRAAAAPGATPPSDPNSSESLVGPGFSAQA